jgi:hypothetical protein
MHTVALAKFPKVVFMTWNAAGSWLLVPIEHSSILAGAKFGVGCMLGVATRVLLVNSLGVAWLTKLCPYHSDSPALF